MNRDETAELLRRRQRLTGHNFNAEVLDTWTEQLADTDQGQAVVAMNRAAAKNRHVNWYEFHEELQAHLHALRNNQTHSPEPCRRCDSSGWNPAPPRPGRPGRTKATEFNYSQVERCEHDDGGQRILPPAEGIPVMLVALETELRARSWDDERIVTKLRSVAGMFALTYLEAIR